ncbi:MAG TPA: ATP-binding protein [Acetivibrio sp.]|uniref:ATP-binding protein n=1 Tax=Acetivibrio sp. TaxID=1872092 RepID=UPI002C1BDDAD|nr:ATP-binding protein [Acetivibrio sp.]HOM02190.1 ATP-binding protein [Acetivibrio sp.]
MDIIQNSITAKATRISILICGDRESDLLEIEVKDNGIGMENDFLKDVTNPFTTTRDTRKVGLGIPLLEASAKMASGGLEITSKKFIGTTVKASFKISHIDRLPLGDLAQTMESLIIARPDIEYDLTLDNKKERFNFNSSDIKRRLGEVPITHFEVIKWIGEYVNDGVKTIFGGILDEILS